MNITFEFDHEGRDRWYFFSFGGSRKQTNKIKWFARKEIKLKFVNILTQSISREFSAVEEVVYWLEFKEENIILSLFSVLKRISVLLWLECFMTLPRYLRIHGLLETCLKVDGKTWVLFPKANQVKNHYGSFEPLMLHFITTRQSENISGQHLLFACCGIGKNKLA